MRRFACVMFGLIGAIGGCRQETGTHDPPPVPSSIMPKLPPLEQFDLTDQDGKSFNSKSLKGEPWVGSFFYANCPGACLRMNQAIQKWRDEHPDTKIKFVSITCDPDNDTPEALKKYAEHFKADDRWIFLTGDMAYIARIGRDLFKMSVTKAGHSDHAAVVDGKGSIVAFFHLLEPNDLKRFEKLLNKMDQKDGEPIEEKNGVDGVQAAPLNEGADADHD